MLYPSALTEISKQIRVAKQIATKAHAGQFRRDGRTPYIEHPTAIVRALERGGYGDNYRLICVAYLHDVLEDTTVTPTDLIDAGFQRDIVKAVMLLTKNPDVSYEDYLNSVKENYEAKIVKIYDIIHNLSDAPTDKQLKKYSKALYILNCT